MRASRSVLSITALVAVLGSSARLARADDPPVAMAPAAQALWDEGQALYASGDYAAAIERFERGRAIDPRPDFLYAIGQALRKAGDCRAAIERYRAFIVESRSERQVEAARLQIERCEQELAARHPPPPSEPAAAPSPAPTEAPPARDAPTSRRWYRDPLGLSLAGAGVAAIAVGGVFALRSRRELDPDDSYGGWEDQLSARRRDRAIAIAAGATGGALVAAALVRFWFLPGGDRPADLALVPREDGAILVLEGAPW